MSCARAAGVIALTLAVSAMTRPALADDPPAAPVAAPVTPVVAPVAAPVVEAPAAPHVAPVAEPSAVPHAAPVAALAAVPRPAPVPAPAPRPAPSAAAVAPVAAPVEAPLVAPIVAPPATPVAAATPLNVRAPRPLELAPAAPSSSRAVTAFTLLLAALGGGAWLWKRRAGAPPARKRPTLEITARRTVGVRSELLIVEIDGQTMLLGVTPGSIQRLAVLADTLSERAERADLAAEAEAEAKAKVEPEAEIVELPRPAPDSVARPPASAARVRKEARRSVGGEEQVRGLQRLRRES